MRYRIFCDGAVRLKPQKKYGDAAIGAFIYEGGTIIAKYGRALGLRTPFQAEMEAILLGLTMAYFSDYDNPIVFTDSEQAVALLGSGRQNVERNILPILCAIDDLHDVFKFDIQKVPRKEVWQADELAHTMLDRLDSKKQGNKRE